MRLCHLYTCWYYVLNDSCCNKALNRLYGLWNNTNTLLYFMHTGNMNYYEKLRNVWNVHWWAICECIYITVLNRAVYLNEIFFRNAGRGVGRGGGLVVEGYSMMVGGSCWEELPSATNYSGPGTNLWHCIVSGQAGKTGSKSSSWVGRHELLPKYTGQYVHYYCCYCCYCYCYCYCYRQCHPCYPLPTPIVINQPFLSVSPFPGSGFAPCPTTSFIYCDQLQQVNCYIFLGTTSGLNLFWKFFYVYTSLKCLFP